MQNSLPWILFLLNVSLCQARNISDFGETLSLERQELLRVAHTLERSLNELRSIEKSKNTGNMAHTRLRKAPDAGPMSQIVTIQDWNGPLESLLKVIAKQYQYKLNIIGKKPVLPLFVSISMEGKSLGTVIQDADLQAGPGAHITVYDHTPRTIELRYAASTV